MNKINWKNVDKNLCVMCDTSLHSLNYHICKKCNKICEIIKNIITPTLLDIKSKCCNADIRMNQRITCGEDCHEVFVESSIIENGTHKKIVDIESGVAYRVPTRLIIERGIQYEDLKGFPVWS